MVVCSYATTYPVMFGNGVKESVMARHAPYLVGLLLLLSPLLPMFLKIRGHATEE